VKLDESNNIDSKGLKVEPSSGKEYLETTNTMFLWGPFKTNAYVSRITSQDREVFNQNLQNYKLNDDTEFESVCFGSLEGIESKNKFDCVNRGGVWDTPVRENQECPYFMSNTNYQNRFGGKRGYSCNVPMGVELVGYRNPSADPKKVPLCYNCKSDLIGEGTLGRCCDKQRNQLEYPNLDTPDYAFSGDSTERKKYNSVFEYRGLSYE
jgi:hypothetical protein